MSKKRRIYEETIIYRTNLMLALFFNREPNGGRK